MTKSINSDLTWLWNLSQFAHEETIKSQAKGDLLEKQVRRSTTEEERIHLLEEMCELSGYCKAMLELQRKIHSILEQKLEEERSKQ